MSAVVGLLLIEGALATLPPLWGSSEAREAHIVALMRDTGEMVLPLRNGLVPSKPPLSHWIAAGVASLVPVSSLVAARWISLLAAIVILLLIRRVAGLFANLSFPLDFLSQSRAEWLAPAILLCCYGFNAVAIDARVDMCFAALVMAAVTSIIGSVTSSELRLGIEREVLQFRFFFFYLFTSFACLAKGPLGLVLPVLIGASWHLVCYGWIRTFKMWISPRVAWLVVPLVVLPWYVLAGLQGGDGFLGRQIVFENIRRFFGGEFVNSQPWYFYGKVMLLTAFPWSLVVLAVSVSSIRKFFSSQFQKSAESKSVVLTFLLLWIWSGVLLFSLSSGKRASYLLPLIPAFALVAALVLVEKFRSLRPVGELRLLKGSRWAFILLMFVVLLFGGALDFLLLPGTAAVARVPFWPGNVQDSARIVQLALGLLLLGVLMCLKIVWRRSDYLIGASLGIIAVLISTGTTIGFTIKGEFKGFSRMAEQVLNAVPRDSSLVVVRDRMDEYFDPLLYYLNRTVKLQDPKILSAVCPGYTLARRSWYESLPNLASDKNVVLSINEWYSALQGDRSKEAVLIQCNALNS